MLGYSKCFRHSLQTTLSSKKGVKGDAVNVLLAAAAYNFNRAMRVLLCLIKNISLKVAFNNFMLKYSF